MRLVLATGIYSPDIGGPATYVWGLAEELVSRGVEVVVVTYGVKSEEGRVPDRYGRSSDGGSGGRDFLIVRVSRSGGSILRWWRYARALREHAADADVVYAFSSVSCGVPLWLARLRKPRRVLRLGGDFLWERYTDRGGQLGLRQFYEVLGGIRNQERGGIAMRWRMGFRFMCRLLKIFDHIVFSTRFQEEIYEGHYRKLPSSSVIENAFPRAPTLTQALHAKHDPFRLLFLGRFVGFKNLPTLLESVAKLEGVTLTMVGDGSLLGQLKAQSSSLCQGYGRQARLHAPIRFLPPTHGEEKQKLFAEHDLLVLPSLTEISPNVALEARSAGLPVLLTADTGLSEGLREGMVVRPLHTPTEIAKAVVEVVRSYDDVTHRAASSPPQRTWREVTDQHVQLFTSLLRSPLG